uniref:protein-tyrosine-phosphatase n=1 Tax=Caenorhabditis tropicalis TaxID=1561998 RepID=A0A1I7UC45_9PELO
MHSLINRNNTFSRMLCKDADTVDCPTPTLPSSRSSSVISITSISPTVDNLVTSGRLIKVAPAKQDTVSIISNESDMAETPRTLHTLSNIELLDSDGDSPDYGLSPTSPPFNSDGAEDVFERVKTASTTDASRNNVKSIHPFRSLYLDEVVWQIDDVVFASAIDAVNNNSLMCRLNIEFICEIADESADHVQEARRQNRGFECPCFCNRASSHFRYYLSFSLPETEQRCMQLTEDTKLNEMFDGFLDLVTRARRANRNVLVCSTRGRNRAPAFASAYLMSKEQIPRQQAVAKVRQAMGTMRPPVNISDFMQRKLMRYQQHLGIDLSNAYDPTHTLPLFHVKRSAWT